VARSDAASADSDPSKSAAKCSASSSTCVVQPWPEPLLPMDPETQKSNRAYEFVSAEHSVASVSRLLRLSDSHKGLQKSFTRT